MKLPVKKCLVVMDTNIVYVGNEDRRGDFFPKDSFNNFWEWVNSNSINDICLFVIPDIIVNEIAKQKQEHNKSQRSKYYECSKFFSVTQEITEENFEDCYFNINDFIQGLGITIVPHPSDIKSIINRAVQKEKPFTGQAGASDKGFKDAVMLHSILEIENISEFDKIFWLTKNSNDFTKDVEAEVANLIIFNSNDSIEKLKRYITENYFWNTKLVKFLETNKAEIIEYLYDTTEIVFSDFSYNSKEFKFDSIKNVIEFNINAIGNDGQSSDFLLFFDLNANNLTEDPSDSDEDTDGV